MPLTYDTPRWYNAAGEFVPGAYVLHFREVVTYRLVLNATTAEELNLQIEAVIDDGDFDPLVDWAEVEERDFLDAYPQAAEAP
jgi:hypothetical protein